MFGIIAMILFGIAYIFNGAGFHGTNWIGPTPFLYLGLFCLAVEGVPVIVDRYRKKS